MNVHASSAPRADARHSAQPSAHERVGFELGWDHAGHRVDLPSPYADEPSALRDGWVAGRAALCTARPRANGLAVQRWLQLRLRAWLRGRSFELFQLTPHYLRQIEVSHCPVTRAPLGAAGAGEPAVLRVRHDGGYAAGNLAMTSRRAQHARARLPARAALALARQAACPGGPARSDAEAEDGFHLGWPERTHRDGAAGADDTTLAPEAWVRLAVLCSFVEPLAHAEAALLPLRVLPPNRLRLFNPVQALQALLSRQFLKPNWSRRFSLFEELLPGRALQADFRRFVLALLPRVLEAGRPGDTLATRWAIEDAWRAPLVQQRWREFALQLDAARCERLVRQAAVHGLATTAVESLRPDEATEGWNLPTRGYLAPDDGDRRQAQLAF